MLGLGLGIPKRKSLSSGSFIGFLDTFGNAYAAWAYWLLKSDYSGALVEIRRDSDNATKDFYPDLNNELSLSSDDGLGTSLGTWIGANNGFVRTKYDQTGNGRDKVQTTSGDQPQIVTAGVIDVENTKAGEQYAGSEYLESGTTSDYQFIHEGGAATIITVARLGATANPNASIPLHGSIALGTTQRGFSFRLDDRSSSGRNNRLQSIVGTNGTYAVNNLSGDNVITPNQLAIITHSIDADNGTAQDRSTISVDNGSEITNNSQTTSVSVGTMANTFKFGAFGDLSAYMTGACCAQIFYQADRSADLADMKATLNNYYATY